jgi:3-oxoacyl-ACP reductase-like protein
MNGKDNQNEGIKRISSQGNCEENSDCSLLEEASLVARRVLESIQEIAGTTAVKDIMNTKEVMIFDVSADLDKEFGLSGTPERKAAEEDAYAFYKESVSTFYRIINALGMKVK